MNIRKFAENDDALASVVAWAVIAVCMSAGLFGTVYLTTGNVVGTIDENVKYIIVLIIITTLITALIAGFKTLYSGGAKFLLTVVILSMVGYLTYTVIIPM